MNKNKNKKNEEIWCYFRLSSRTGLLFRKEEDEVEEEEEEEEELMD